MTKPPALPLPGRPESLPLSCAPFIRTSLEAPFFLTGLAALLLVVASVAGLLFGQSGLYDPNPRTLPALLGQDAITLVVGLPLLVTSLVLARRGSLRGFLFWTGILYYVVYSYGYYVFVDRYNSLVLVYIVLWASSFYALLWAVASSEPAAIKARFSQKAPNRLFGGFLLFVAGFLTLLWGGLIGSSLASGAPLDPILGRIGTLDLTMPVPAFYLVGFLLWKDHAWGYALGGVALVKGAFLGLTLCVTAIAATFWGVALDALLPFYALTGLGGLYITIRYFRSVESDR